MTTPRLLVSALALIAVLGGGCPTPSFNLTKVHPLQPSGRMAFGKIGGFNAGGKAEGAMEAGNVVFTASSLGAPGMAVATMPARDAAGGMALMVDPAMPGSMPRPMPPVPQKLATVEYVLPEGLPTWGEEGDVIKLGRSMPDAKTAGLIAERSGLPSAVLNRVTEITGVNVQWKDGQGLAWSYDAASRSLSAWRENYSNDQGSPLKMPPDRTEAIAIADSFLDSHGFGDIKARGGTVEPSPWEVMPMVAGGGTSAMAYPCLMERSVSSDGGMTPPPMATPPSAPMSDLPVIKMMAPIQQMPMEDGQEDVATDVAPAIWPSPCGWDYSQVTVTYPEKRDGQSVVQLGGYPAFAGSVVVDLRNKRISSVSLMLTRPTERSAYPLIDAATAKRRLQAGGLNPIWPYADSGSIKVTVEKVELVWLRHESWKEGTSLTYDLPALLATGSVQRGDSKTEEQYRTVVPLLTDDALDESIDWGGSGGMPVPSPTPLMMEAGETKY
jgi:hypothetical protein